MRASRSRSEFRTARFALLAGGALLTVIVGWWIFESNTPDDVPRTFPVVLTGAAVSLVAAAGACWYRTRDAGRAAAHSVVAAAIVLGSYRWLQPPWVATTGAWVWFATAGIGYLLKERVSDLAEFVDACTAVADGGSVIDAMVAERLMRRRANDDVFARLTDRERDVLGAMARGLSNQAIADELYLGKKTIETHVGSIFQKLDLGESGEGNRRVQAVLQFLNARE